jgi:hypothetical protein
VQPVCEFYQDNSHIIDHCQQHLPKVFSLTFLACGKRYRADLRNTFDNMGYFRPEQLTDTLNSRQGVLDNVMQQACGDSYVIKLHVSDQRRYFEGMCDVILARTSPLTPVFHG